MRKMSTVYSTAVSAAALMTLAAGCATAPKGEDAKANLNDNADSALRQMYRNDPTLSDFVQTSAGYAVFPEVGKGGLVVGGSYGRGIVYEGGSAIGYSDVSKASVGAIAGGQTFSQVIVFQNKTALETFKSGKYAFAADASAVALKNGVAATAKYNNGVAVFVEGTGGLMVDASVGGQKFTYQPMGK